MDQLYRVKIPSTIRFSYLMLEPIILNKFDNETLIFLIYAT